MSEPVSIAFPQRLRRGLKGLAWAVGIVAALGVIVSLAGPPLAKSALERTASDAIGRRISVDRILFNPYALTASVEGVRVSEADGTTEFLSVEEIFADASLVSLLRLAPVVSRLRVVAPRVRLVRGEDRRYSFQDIIDRLAARPAPQRNSGPARFALENLEIVRGSIDFDDRPEKARHQVSELRFSLPFVSSLPAFSNEPVEPVLSGRMNGAPFELKGRTLPFQSSLETKLRVEVDQVDLRRYVEYVPLELNFALASGVLGGHVEAIFKRGKDRGIEALSLGGELALESLDLKDRGGRPLVRAGKISVAFGQLDLVERRLEITRLAVDSPELVVVRDSAGRINLDSLSVASAAPEPRTGAARPFQVDLKAFEINNGKARWTDESLARPYRFETDDLNLDAVDLSTREGQTGRFSLSLSGRTRETLSASGSMSLAPLAAEVRVRAGRLQLANFAPYLAGVLRAGVEGSAEFTATLAWGGAPETKTGMAPGLRIGLEALDLQGLRVALPDAELVRIGALQLRGLKLDAATRKVMVTEIAARDPLVTVRRAADGTLNLDNLLVANEPPAPQSGASAAADFPAWEVDLRRVSLKGGAADWEDLAAPRPVKLRVAPIDAQFNGLSTRPGVTGRIESSLGFGNGSLGASGELALAPLSGRIEIDAKSLGIVLLQPYFEPFLNVTVNSGAVSARGRLTLDPPQQSGGVPRIGYTGSATLADLALIERGSTGDLARWKSLHAGGIDLATVPFALTLGEIALSEFFARIAVSPEGRINLQDVLVVRGTPPTAAKPPAAAPAAKEAQAASKPLPVKIGTVTLQGGRVNFSDQFIKPNYSARLTDLAGRVSGLSADSASRADVEIRGKVDGSAPLEISGRINPLAGNLFLDMQAKVRGLELTPFTPYSARYVGYGIEKGKLSVDLKYRLEDRKLDASNKVYLDQLTFGEKVESPDAIKLPVLLAVALLKNSRGEIDIDLPISGSLDDPQFSVGGIVVKVIVNLLVKAVTTPFALLGALFGGAGEELSFVEFAPGRAMIRDAQAKKLQNLAKALAERPGLKLEVAGRADAEADREGLRRLLLERKVRARKLAERVRSGESAEKLEQIRVEPGEYETWLRRAYERETFPKPRNVVGLLRVLPVEDMEKLMLTNITVGEEELRSLAQRRAQAVKLWLERSGGVSEERIFLVAAGTEPEDGRREGAARAPAVRVDLSLR